MIFGMTIQRKENKIKVSILKTYFKNIRNIYRGYYKEYVDSNSTLLFSSERFTTIKKRKELKPSIA